MKQDGAGIDPAVDRSRTNSRSGAQCTSRREFLKSTAMLGASALLSPRLLQVQIGAQGADSNPRRIDVHSHILPPVYMREARERILAIADINLDTLTNWTITRTIEDMDRNGTATAITSLGLPGVSLGNQEAARKLARTCNEFAAQLVRDNPGRFGLFTTLPMPDLKGSLREIEYGYDQLQADGVGLLTSYGNKWPGDPVFSPVFEELNRRKAIVFVHPTQPACCGHLIPEVAPPVTEFLFDTTRAITSLLVNGTLSRFADIRFIFCHAGGTMLPLANRINAYVGRRPEIAARVPYGTFYEFKKLHYDVANSANKTSLGALLSLVPAEQLVFGSDFPYVAGAVTANGLDRYGLSPADLAAINRQNALRLFPRLNKLPKNSV
jgi:predicted TIM-barrel fold metal-dependent hydrolase